MEKHAVRFLVLVLVLFALGGVSLACQPSAATNSGLVTSTGTVSKTFPTPLPTPTTLSAAMTGGSGGSADSGKAVFASNCTACHPDGKQGVGPSLAGIAGTMTLEQLTSRIRDGKGVMPGFPASKISDAQMGDLIAFLKTLQ